MVGSALLRDATAAGNVTAPATARSARSLGDRRRRAFGRYGIRRVEGFVEGEPGSPKRMTRAQGHNRRDPPSGTGGGLPYPPGSIPSVPRPVRDGRHPVRRGRHRRRTIRRSDRPRRSDRRNQRRWRPHRHRRAFSAAPASPAVPPPPAPQASPPEPARSLPRRQRPQQQPRQGSPCPPPSSDFFPTSPCVAGFPSAIAFLFARFVDAALTANGLLHAEQRGEPRQLRRERRIPRRREIERRPSSAPPSRGAWAPADPLLVTAVSVPRRASPSASAFDHWLVTRNVRENLLVRRSGRADDLRT